MPCRFFFFFFVGLTAGFDLDDLSNIPFDGSYLGDDVASLSDLPPFLLNKLMSRSRSNSLCTTPHAQNGVKGDEGVDPVTSSSAAAASNTATASGHPAAGTDLNITLQRVRGYSFEFFSLGFNAEEPLPAEASSGGNVDEEATPLIKNSALQRPRGNSIIFDLSDRPNQRPRGDSVFFDISDKPSQRPRGDSIIFDPCSFSDGGIHEQRALLIKGHSSIGSISEFDVLLTTSAGDR